MTKYTFTKTSVFSQLNNLTDITMIEEYADICGIPVDSLEEGKLEIMLDILRGFFASIPYELHLNAEAS
ncbi:MAG: AAA family ATPase [Oscillospiraceae bacterium]|nr:AAA family ATPase [Oscillospiraceae bacterium]